MTTPRTAIVISKSKPKIKQAIYKVETQIDGFNISFAASLSALQI